MVALLAVASIMMRPHAVACGHHDATRAQVEHSGGATGVASHDGILSAATTIIIQF